MPSPRARSRGLIVLSSLIVFTLPACTRRASSPHVVLIVVDTLRADHLGAYGYRYPTSPSIDALASRGVIFDRAYSPGTWTKPAIASLFTALLPSEHGILWQLKEDDPEVLNQGLHPSLPTLAERFRAAGHRTIGVVQQPNLPRALGFARGFDVYDQTSRGDAFAQVARLLERVDAASGSRGASSPLFLYLHLLDVHWPYDEQLPGIPLDAFGAIAADERIPFERAAIRKARRRDFAGVDWPTLRARYDHGVAWTDAAVGRLVAGLEARGLLSNALVALTSDHGEGFFEHGRFEHNYDPYEEVARIPLIVRFPDGRGVAPGRRGSVVGLADLGPTLLDLAGLPRWTGTSGRSFANVVRGGEDPDRVALVQAERSSAVVGLGFKAIVDRNGRDGRVRYFDLRRDPGERLDLAANVCEEPCRAAVARLRAIERELREPPPKMAAPETLSPEQLEELRALDYL
jgi:arylsulfatase A-like enzyme